MKNILASVSAFTILFAGVLSAEIITKESSDSVYKRVTIQSECNSVAPVEIQSRYIKNNFRDQMVRKMDQSVKAVNGNALVITKLNRVDHTKMGKKFSAEGIAYQCSSATLSKLGVQGNTSLALAR
ncbi:MAG: hypothetical protein KDK41_06585 [Leptospiraceae bacterium]|nr:hypothetical protein [Leptospiraceae bacterium]MCB1200294.1 hypothetical protein [Leptospiraceae bacterium]